MEVKPGYKRTEVGVIPEDWELKALAGVSSIAHGFGFQSQYFKPLGNYRLTTPGHFYETGGFRDVGDKQKFYDGPLPGGYLLSEGDLIVAMTEQADGLLGSAAFVPTNETYLHNQRIGKVKVLSLEVSITFLYCVFNSQAYRAKVRETAAGTKVKHTSPSKLLGIPVALPPTKAEQEAIATALSDADALIESLEQLVAKKRNLKQATMQQLLTGKKRLPGFKEEWEETHLGQCGTTYGGLTGKEKADFGQGAAKYVTFLNVMNHIVIDVTQLEAVNVHIGERQNAVLKGDLLFNGSSETPEEVGMCAVLLDNLTGVYLNSFCFGFRLRDDSNVDGLYLVYFLRSDEGRKLLYPLAQGATRHNLSKTALMAIKFAMPCKSEQVAIAAVLSDMDAEIDELESELSKARQIKQGMMQELLTGKTRLA